jgi:predicted dehydrogenase
MSIPAPQIIAPSSVPSLRWGVLAPGSIAGAWVSSVQKHTTQQVVAVASRTPGRAAEFAEVHSISKVYQTYEELLADETIDAVYVASRAGDHFAHGKQVLDAGKHLLVEKPITYLASEAEQLLAHARSKGLFAMEAMWTRYLPQASVIDQLVPSMGKPELLVATFATDNRVIERLWQKGGGGVVHDMGIYPIAIAQQLFGDPVAIEATGKISDLLIDSEAVVNLSYASGASATLIMSMQASLPQTVSASFEQGVLNIHAPFLAPSGITLTDKNFYARGETWLDESEVQGHEGLSYQATAFASYVAAGMLESPVHTHAQVVDNIRVAEEIVRQLGARPF